MMEFDYLGTLCLLIRVGLPYFLHFHLGAPAISSSQATPATGDCVLLGGYDEIVISRTDRVYSGSFRRLGTK
jgi:hypothetical protein